MRKGSADRIVRTDNGHKATGHHRMPDGTIMKDSDHAGPPPTPTPPTDDPPPIPDVVDDAEAPATVPPPDDTDALDLILSFYSVHEPVVVHAVPELTVVAHARVSCFSCAYSTRTTWSLTRERSKLQIESARVVSSNTFRFIRFMEPADHDSGLTIEIRLGGHGKNRIQRAHLTETVGG